MLCILSKRNIFLVRRQDPKKVTKSIFKLLIEKKKDFKEKILYVWYMTLIRPVETHFPLIWNACKMSQKRGQNSVDWPYGQASNSKWVLCKMALIDTSGKFLVCYSKEFVSWICSSKKLLGLNKMYTKDYWAFRTNFGIETESIQEDLK